MCACISDVCGDIVGCCSGVFDDSILRVFEIGIVSELVGVQCRDEFIIEVAEPVSVLMFSVRGSTERVGGVILLLQYLSLLEESAWMPSHCWGI